MSGTIEYRVRWRREGLRARERRYMSLGPVRRCADFMAGRTVASHDNCEHDADYCSVISNAAYPPLVDGPHIERRTVGPWEPVP